MDKRYSPINANASTAASIRKYAEMHKRPLWAIVEDAMILYAKVYDPSVNPKSPGRTDPPAGQYSKRGRPRQPRPVQEVPSGSAD